MTPIAFDDIAALERCMDTQWGPWGEQCEVTQEMIDRFADLTHDHQWIHVDRERARGGPFGVTVAHGFLVLSLLPAVRPLAAFSLAGHSAVANFGSTGLRFLDPVPAGSRIHAHDRLMAVEAHRRGTLTTQEVAIHVVDNPKPALLYQLQLLYMP
jgi:acyl dehydratase